MTIAEQDIDSAILGIFSGLRLPAGGRVTLSTLAEEWPRRGLQAGDLEQGLRRLLHCGHLHLDQGSGIELVVLTARGHDYARSLAAPGLLRGLWRRLGGGLDGR